MAKHGHGLYDESPHIEDDGAGNKKVKKAEGKEAKSSGKEPHIDGAEEKGVEGEHFPIHVRHAHERHHMHVKHEHEHSLHDHHHGVHGKEEMHARHEHEFKSMHTRHEKEAGAHGGAESGAGGATGKISEPIEKAEKGKKE